MSKIKRVEFLKMGAWVMLTPLCDGFLTQAMANTGKNYLYKDDILQRLLTANDNQVALLLESVNPGNLKFSRKTGYHIAVLSASYCSRDSAYYHNPLLASKLNL